MNRMPRVRYARGIAAIVVACLAGCQYPDHRPWPRRDPSPGGGLTSRITAAQEADVQIALGRAAERRGDVDQAMAAYADALKRDRRRADACQRLAILHDGRGEFRQSADLYRQAIEASPGNAEIFCDMGYSLYLQRRWAESEQNLRQAIALDPGSARAHNNLGLVLGIDRRAEEAVAEFRKAGNDEAAARNNLALALTLDGRWDEARAQYQRALAANPAAPEARDRLKELDVLVARAAPRPGAAKDDRLITASATAPSPRPAGSSKAPVVPPPGPVQSPPRNPAARAQ